MRIAYITAGAAGMYCGSCLHDNTLVSALIAQGHDALLIPTYTPIRTDETDVSQARVFFGGINVYLQQKHPLFRHTPWVMDRLLDARGLLRLASGFAAKTQAEDLGDLTISMLKGEHGYQRKEIAKLLHWLIKEVRPEIINLTNVLLSGMVPELKRRLKAPILATLQGDDVFLEALPEPFRSQALELIREHCREIEGFLATSRYYADFMADYFAIAREKIHVVYPGLNLQGHGGEPGDSRNREFTIGYFARICPEKGLHLLVKAFRILQQTPGAPTCRLRVSGWLGQNNQNYFDGLQNQIHDWGLADRFEHVESPDHAGKIRFLQSLDVLSVPTTYPEPKGLYVLEALANGVPVVQPRHGSFPELLEQTGGGLLVNPHDPEDLAQGLRQLLEDPTRREQHGRQGREVVHQDFNADKMAEKTVAIYRKYFHA
jgi:glycosyltransferase involved in cell wall biosynthesis